MRNGQQGKSIVAIDLFAGAGGFSEGLAASGVSTALAQELHPQPALTYAFNHPSTPVLVGDIRRIDVSLMESLLLKHAHVKGVDVVVGGPPCQGFSTAGKKSKVDPRNTLFFNFFKVVEHFRPALFVLENVPGFRKMYGGHAYEAAAELFSSLGYSLQDTILNACDYGVPQRRNRFVMVGVQHGVKFRWPARTHLNPEGKSLELFGATLAAPVTVGNALADLAYLKPGFEGHRHARQPTGEYQMSRRNGCEHLFNHLATRHRDRAVEMFSHIPEGGTISQVPALVKSGKRTMARLDRNHISNSVLALPDDLIHYQQPRIPTVREMARLQSFDDDYVFMGKRTSGFVQRRVDVPQYTQVGNAVPPLLAAAIAKEIVRSLGGRPQDLREKPLRRTRHEWLRGSSGFSGYALGREAHALLYSAGGKLLDLPVDESDTAVVNLPRLVEWKAEQAKTRRSQWAPGINTPRKARRQEARRAVQTRPRSSP